MFGGSNNDLYTVNVSTSKATKVEDFSGVTALAYVPKFEGVNKVAKTATKNQLKRNFRSS